MNAQTILANRYDRHTFGDGVLGWIYEYKNVEPIRKRQVMATGLEVAVQLRGEWFQAGRRSGARLYEPGVISTLSPAERYDLRCQAKPYVSGLQVGFIVYPEEVFPADPHVELLFRPEEIRDKSFFEFCRALECDASSGRPWREAQVRAEVLAFVKKHSEWVFTDPLLAARRELDHTFAQPLYVRHLAEVAEMHPVTFARKFAARFGTTPARYRLDLRLNEAARLTWSEPTTPIPDIARRVGFEDMAYFHRAFLQSFRVTPARYARRHVASRSRTAPSASRDGLSI